MTAPSAAVEADHLSARYATQVRTTPALLDVCLSAKPGERVLLLGPNGAGKSTLIRVLAGLMRPTAGRVHIFGRPPAKARQVVGVVGHRTYLYDELTARENLRLYGDLYAVDRAEERAAELLDRVGIAALADEQVGRLSRGQQQRVAIARAFLHDPPLLLLDEPDTGLDVAAFRLLEDLATSGERTVILTTHNLAAGLRVGTRVVVLARGRVAYESAAVGPADAEELSDLVRGLAGAPR